MEKKLSWNKEYYLEDTWRYVDGERKNKEVDHLPSNHCDECGYSGEDENGGDPDCGLECIYEKTGINDKGHYWVGLYLCNKCKKLYIDYWRKGDGFGNYNDGWWTNFENETDLNYVFGLNW